MRFSRKPLSFLLSIALLLGLLPLAAFSTVAATQTSLFPPLQLVDTRDRVDQFDNSNPTLLTYQYTAPADAPAAPGDVFEPALQGTAVNSPVISTITAHAGGDDTIVIEGLGLANADVWAFAQTTAANGAYYKLSKIAGSDTTITAALPGFDDDTMYLVWVANNQGYSRPARINAPAVEWISHTAATVGSTVHLYGTDLTLDDGAKPYVYLRPWGAAASTASVAVEVTDYNAYRVGFTLPAGLTTDTDYEVWLHTGHGGRYGWAGPQRITVSASEPYVWNGKTIDVTAYGATTAAGNDDTDAVAAAINNASAGDIIYFPEGHYTISRQIPIYTSLYLKGAGAKKSIIQVASDFVEKEGCDESWAYNLSLFIFYKSSAQVTDLGFTDAGFKTQAAPPRFLQFRLENTPRNTTTTIIRSCEFLKDARTHNAENRMDWVSDPVAVFEGDRVIIEDNYFHAPHGPYLNRCRRIFIRNNEFQGNWILGNSDGPNMVQMEGPRMADVSNNEFYAQDAVTDPDGRLDFGDYGVVRAICVQQNLGPAKNLYIAKNTTEKLGNPANNCGELILLEHVFMHYKGYPTAVSADGKTLTFADAMPGYSNGRSGVEAGSVAVIVKGRGVGQFRQISAVQGNTITLQSGWNIAPDTTSHVVILNAFYNTVLYENAFDGYPNFYEKFNAGAGFNAYGSVINFRAEGNSFSNLMAGIRLSPFYQVSDDVNQQQHVSIHAGAIVERNTLSNVCWGVAFGLYHGYADGTGEIPAHAAIHTVIRKNTISNIRKSPYAHLVDLCGNGIMLGSPYKEYSNWLPNTRWDGAWVKNTVIEDNTITNAENHYILLMQHQGDTVLRNNTLVGATANNGVVREVEWAAAAVEAASTCAPLQVVPLDSSAEVDPPEQPEPEDTPASDDANWIVGDNGTPVENCGITYRNGVATYTANAQPWHGITRFYTVTPGGRYKLSMDANLSAQQIQIAFEGGYMTDESETQKYYDGWINYNHATGGTQTIERDILIEAESSTLKLMLKNGAAGSLAVGTLSNIQLVPTGESGGGSGDGSGDEPGGGSGDDSDDESGGESGGGSGGVSGYLDVIKNGSFAGGAANWVVGHDGGPVDYACGITVDTNGIHYVNNSSTKVWHNAGQTITGLTHTNYLLEVTLNMTAGMIQVGVDPSAAALVVGGEYLSEYGTNTGGAQTVTRKITLNEGYDSFRLMLKNGNTVEGGANGIAVGTISSVKLIACDENWNKITVGGGTCDDGHDWADATCTAPKTCGRCGATEGESLGHNWKQATALSLGTCDRCHAVQGTALAMIGQRPYASLANALAEAVDNDVITLLADVTEGDVLLRKSGLKLDLNGFVLTAEYVWAVRNSSIVDYSAAKTGVLKVPQETITLCPANEQLALWNGVDGYVFTTVEFTTYGIARKSQTDDSFTFWMTPEVQSNAMALLTQKETTTLGLTFVVRLSWMHNGAPVTQEFTFADAVILDVYQKRSEGQNYGFRLTVTGASGLDCQVNGILTSSTGATVVGRSVAQVQS